MGAVGHDLALAKATLRRDVRARRAARAGDERARLAVLLRDLVMAAPLLTGARTVACYVSLRGEPGTGPLRAALQAAGVRVLLPVVPPPLPPRTTAAGPTAPTAAEPAPQRLDWAVDDGTTAPGLLGTAAPTGPRLGPDALAGADVVLVPALLVDTLGQRVGQGGGYYDVTLTALAPAPPVVALVHDDELVDAGLLRLPCGPLDHPVAAVATPARWWDVG